MKKLSIIGKGTAGIIAVNHFASYTQDDELEIECYYDSSKPEQTVGEGTTVDFPQTLNNTQGLEFHDIFKLCNGNFKTGIHYIGWGKQDYMHTFPMPQVSIHFNAVMLQKLLMEKNKGRVKFIDKAVEHKDINTDYILDCSGKPNDNSSFYEAKYIPVNTALVYQCKWDKPLYTHTLCIADNYGWIFGIPLQDRISFGYIYNRNINTKEQVNKRLLKVIDKYKQTPNDNPLHLEFNNYYRKVNFTEHVAYNGNASFFLEPMEATSIATIDDINRFAFDVVFNINNLDFVNAKYGKWFKEVQDIITLHYLAGSKYDNKFWRHAKQLAQDCFNDKSQMLSDILKNKNNPLFNINNYGTWGLNSFNQNIDGLGIDIDVI